MRVRLTVIAGSSLVPVVASRGKEYRDHGRANGPAEPLLDRRVAAFERPLLGRRHAVIGRLGPHERVELVGGETEERRDDRDLDVVEQGGGVSPAHRLRPHPCPDLRDVLAPVPGAGQECVEISGRGPVRSDFRGGSGQRGHQRLIVGGGPLVPDPAVLDERQRAARLKRLRDLAQLTSGSIQWKADAEKAMANPPPGEASSNRRLTNRTLPGPSTWRSASAIRFSPGSTAVTSKPRATRVRVS